MGILQGQKHSQASQGRDTENRKLRGGFYISLVYSKIAIHETHALLTTVDLCCPLRRPRSLLLLLVLLLLTKHVPKEIELGRCEPKDEEK